MSVDAATASLLAPTTVSLADIDDKGEQIALLANLDTETPQLWLLRAGGPPERLTDHGDKVALGRFRPRGTALLYGLDDGGDERQQLHLFDLTTKTSRALTAAPHANHEFGGFSPDGTTIAYTSNVENGVDFDVFIRRLDAQEPVRVMRGQGLRKVEAWAPDNRWLVVSSDHGTSIGELHRLDTATGSVRPLLGGARPATAKNLRFLPSGDLLMCTDRDRDHLGVARLSPHDGRFEWCIAFDADIELLALAKDKRRAAIAVNHAGYHVLEVHDLETRELIRRWPTAGVLADLRWTPDGAALLATLQTPLMPPRPWRFDMATGAAQVLAGLQADAMGVSPTLVHIPTFDGRSIPAFLYRPEIAAPAGGRPAIVCVHGGPESQWRPAYRGYVQAFVARGWTVLAPNVRGSSGYGRHYASLDDRDRRMDSASDLERCARWLGAEPDVDATRLAVMGQSYGGFMVLATLVEHPELWRAGVEFFGISDFNSFFRETSAYRRNHRAAEYGDPVAHATMLAAFSPLPRIEHLKAPLFVAHGLSDPRVPPLESEQLLAALEARKHPVVRRIIPKEGHGFVKRRNQLDVFGGVLDFLEAHL